MESGQLKKKNKCSRLLSACDSYGHPVSLTFEGEDTYKTSIGGIVTLLSGSIIIAYFIYEMVGVLNNHYTLTINTQHKNLVEDTTIVDVNTSVFDLAVHITTDTNNFTRNLHYFNYMKVYVAEIYTYWLYNEDGIPTEIIEEEEYPIDYCSSGRFLNDTDFAEEVHLEKNFLCIPDTNFSLQGSYGSRKSRSIELKFAECQQDFLDKTHPGEKCVTDETEISEVLHDFKITVAMLNQYFDGEEFEGSPVMAEVNLEFFTIHEGISETYLYKYSNNHAFRTDSMWSNVFFEQEDSYISVKYAHVYQNVPDGDKYPYLGVVLILDETETLIYRETKTILEALSNTGGIMGFIVATFKFLIMYYQEFKYRQAVLFKIFKYEERETDSKKEAQTGNDSRVQLWPKEGSQRGLNELEIYKEDSTPVMSTVKGTVTEQDRKTIDTLDEPLKMIQNFKLIYSMLIRRVPFYFTLSELFHHHVYSRLCCAKKDSRILRQNKLFGVGLQKLEKEFDITQVIKQNRAVSIMSSVLFFKYQRFLLPLFKRNMLQTYEEKTEKDHADQELEEKRRTTSEKEKKGRILNSLMQVLIEYKNKSETDKKIAELLIWDKKQRVKQTLSYKIMQGTLMRYMMEQLDQEEKKDVSLRAKGRSKKRNRRSSVSRKDSFIPSLDQFHFKSADKQPPKRQMTTNIRKMIALNSDLEEQKQQPQPAQANMLELKNDFEISVIRIED